MASSSGFEERMVLFMQSQLESLSAEVTSLRKRNEELEEENKKWRNLALEKLEKSQMESLCTVEVNDVNRRSQELECENKRWRNLGFDKLEKVLSVASIPTPRVPSGEDFTGVHAIVNDLLTVPPVYTVSKREKNDGTEVDYIHLGNDVWVTRKKYETLLSRPTDGKFVGDLSVLVCGTQMMLTHSVTGMASNRFKRRQVKPAIPVDKLNVIRDRFRDYLLHRNCSSEDIGKRLKFVNKHVAQKTVSLCRNQRMNRKDEILPHTDSTAEQTEASFVGGSTGEESNEDISEFCSGVKAEDTSEETMSFVGYDVPNAFPLSYEESASSSNVWKQEEHRA